MKDDEKQQTGREEPINSAPNAGKKVLIKSFGCQMNVYDSERMAGVLAKNGFSETSAMEDADLVVLNTCHIREKAAEKVYSELGRVRVARDQRRKAGADMTIAVAGCVAQAEGEEILHRSPAVDIVVGPQSYHRLPQILKRRHETSRPVVDTNFMVTDKFAQLPLPPRPSPSAFLTVQEGCNKFCTFCVVPYTRGAEFSRPLSEILREAQALAARGVKEITLLGQNVNAYRSEGVDGKPASLSRLIAAISEIPEIVRIRFTTSHPNDMTEDLIFAFRDLPKLMPYLHLPIQSGSDRILNAMNRKHSVATFFSIVDRIRQIREDIALSTDIIVGFPGETDSDFDETMRAVERVGFAQAFSFKYSSRPGTPAAERGDQVPEATKVARLSHLQDVLKNQQMRFNEAMVGRTLDVLWEYQTKQAGYLAGKTPYLQTVIAEAPLSLLGRITQARIAAAGPNSVQAVIKTGEQSAIH